MARGSFKVTTSNSYISGRVEWSSTPNTSGNYSTVTATLYLSRTNTGYTTYGSGTMHLNIDGTSFSNSDSWSITYNSNTVMITATKTVYHNSDGTKSITISWAGSMDTPLTVNNGSGTAVLDTIPRASTVASNVSFTAGTQNLAVSLNVASSSFTHTLTLQVQKPDSTWVTVATRTNVGSSTTMTFSQSELTSIYSAMSQSASRPVKLNVTTYSGGNVVGSTQSKTGTVYAVSTASISFDDFNIGDDIPASVSPMYSGFTYSGTFTFGSFTKTFTFSPTTPNPTLTFTSTEIQNMYSQVPNSNSGTGTVQVTTKYNGVTVRSASTFTFTAYVTNSNPTIVTSGFSYKDNNATTKALTGNDQYIIQNKSDLVINIPANGATAVNGASMTANGARYEFTINGVTKTMPYTSSATTFDFGTVNANGNTNLTIKAVDSRGNSASITIPITVVPYSPPVVVANATRANGFDTNTTLTLSGSVSPLNINGTNKNAIVSAQYQYKQSSGGSYGSLNNFTVTGFPNYSATNVVVPLDNTMAWDINFVVTDKLGTTSVVKTVLAGVPIFFIDSVKNSVGVNKFPSGLGTFEVKGGFQVYGLDSTVKFSVDGSGNVAFPGGLSVGKITSTSSTDTLETASSSGIVIDQSGNFRPKSTMSSTGYWHVDDVNGNQLFKIYLGSSPSGFELNPQNGGVKITGNANNNLKLIGTSHVYMEFYPQGIGTRMGWIGFGAAGVQDLSVNSANGNVLITPSGGKSATFKSFGTSSGGLVGYGYAMIKWLASGITQIRKADDSDYADLQVRNLNYSGQTLPSSRGLKRDIEAFNEELLPVINDIPMYTFNYLTDDIDAPKRLGTILEEAPEFILDSSGKGIEMTKLQWATVKAIQELYEYIKYLEDKINSR
ncbi:DUF859 family phage minor structural protein [Collinsella aerofaciens]|uniref:DUF859 family phage minor structural protein n=1 Tax=Collinsella aerofaciens TaxID=74426 RepID=UPI001D03153A|nr:DUF859 family phage minor structural protein [Collinsella aerofaciens]MCB5366911.1 DUF859 domain-containing protein [Collinsella aerofaciens]MCB5368964.1 DUF859 domain-containing protein [Collinsella aerofaciens]